MDDNIKKHYKTLFNQYGNAPESVQYSDKKTQYKRFEILSEIDRNLASVIDVGCGLAHLYDYLASTGYKGKYLGLDFVEEFIEANQQKYGQEDKLSFKTFDINKDNIDEGYDYIMLSGVFNNKSDNNEEFMYGTIKKMYDACQKGVAFNAMSTYVDFQADNLYYSNPLDVFDFCKKNLTRKVTLRHDYLVKENSIPFEYCIYLYK